jgi:quinol monooxygenase YgiN
MSMAVCYNYEKPREVVFVYTIYVKFDCLPQKRESFIQKMKQTGILDAIRAEDGCIKYEYYLAEKDPNALLLIEQWESKQHQQVHIKQPHMANMREFKDDYITRTTLGEVDLL